MVIRRSLHSPTAGAKIVCMFNDPRDPQHRQLLKDYLTWALQADVSELAEDPILTSGGVENRNFILQANVDGQPRKFILRCPPEEVPDWRSTHGLYDIQREYNVLRELEQFDIGAPQAGGYNDGSYFGVPCFLMEALAGDQLTGHLVPKIDQRLLKLFAAKIGQISAIDYEKSAWMAENLPRWTNDWWFGYFEETVDASLKDDFFNTALKWLRDKQPAARKPVFAHGDANPGNFLVSGSEITGVVDWEFAGVADDPLNEIGFFAWLFDGQLAKPLAQELCEYLKRDIRETKWYFVRSWVGVTWLGTDPASELFRMRRETLAQLIGTKLA
jgi:aminoglycoside phosphotransferase (APT) family kinase protein